MTNPPVTEEAVERVIRRFKNGDMDAGGTIAALERIARAAIAALKSPPVVSEDDDPQDEWFNPLHRIALRAGFLLCREYMARFVEQGGDANTAASIRANWIPAMGDDPGPPRKLAFDECVSAEDMEAGPWEAKDPGLAAEAACYALCAMSEFGMELEASPLAMSVKSEADQGGAG